MSQVLTSRRRTATSLRGHRDAHTVLLRMALDEERAKRIRQLKEDRPDLTWAQIAEAVGVKERSAIDWQKTGGISYENCKKLAKLFKVDRDWLWAGTEQGTPDLMGALGDQTQLDRIEAKLDELLSRFPAMGPAEILEAEAARVRAQREQSAAKSTRKTPRRKAS